MKENGKIEIRCPKCHKLLGKIENGGICEKLYLFCRYCKQEIKVTINADECKFEILENKENGKENL